MDVKEVAALLSGTVLGEETVCCDFDCIQIDSRLIESGDVFLALEGAHHDGHDFISEVVSQGAAAVIVRRVDPEQPVPQIQVKDTAQALLQLGAICRSRFSVPVVGITGSCGKTSVRALLSSILSCTQSVLASIKSYNNNIGVPLTLCRYQSHHDVVISEMGVSHEGDMGTLVSVAQPTIATITNIAPAHLAGFTDMDAIAREKSRIFEYLSADGVAVLNRDDYYYHQWVDQVGPAAVLSFGLDASADVRATDIFMNEQGQAQFSLHLPAGETHSITLSLLGRHQVLNALNAAACAVALGASGDVIVAGLEKAVPEPGRMVRAESRSGAIVIDDSYNANPLSMRAALDTLATYVGKRVAVLGDMLELGEQAVDFHRSMGAYAKERGIDALYVYGPLSRHTAEAFGSEASAFDSHESLASALEDVVGEGAVVLVKGSRSMQMNRIVELLRGQ